jgi:hypothetical protein
VKNTRAFSVTNGFEEGEVEACPPTVLDLFFSFMPCELFTILEFSGLL